MNRFVQTIKAIRDVVLYVLMFLTAISYHPTIINLSRIEGYENGTILSRYIILLFGVVFLLSFCLSAVRYSKLMRTYLIWLSIIAVAALFIQAFYNNREMTHELRTFIIVLCSIMIGYDLDLTRRRFVFFLLVFGLTTLFSGITQVMVNNGGFKISSQYLTDAKNSLGAMLATTCFSLFFLYRSLDKSLLRIGVFLVTLLTLVVIVTIRARMALVSLALVGMYYYYLINRNRNVLITFIIVGVLLFFGVLLMPSFVVDYVVASFSAGTQSEDFTSGRLLTYAQAIDYLKESPFLGNILEQNQISLVHNYLLLKLYQFGLLFSWPIIVLYLIIVVKAIKRSLSIPPYSQECFAYVCLLIPYLISLAEPTFPFGPGTVTIFNFFLLGMAEKSKVNNKKR